MTYKVLDLFSGIGGFSLGLERTGGFETVAFCEIEKYPQQVLAKHWPGVPIYNDVMELTNERLKADGIFPDVITGGFPCQDISVAGNQKGIGEGTRSGLWSECARLVGSVRPRYSIFENVSALLSGGGTGGEWFQRVLFDISEIGGYEVEWHCISASELGAHHHRDRVWIILTNTDNTRNSPSKCGDNGFGSKTVQKQTQQSQLESGRQGDVPNTRLPESQGRIPAKADNDRCGEAGIQQGSESSSCGSDASNSVSTNGGRGPATRGSGGQERGSSQARRGEGIQPENREARSDNAQSLCENVPNPNPNSIQQSGSIDRVAQGVSTNTTGKRGRSGNTKREDAEDAWQPPICTREHFRRVEMWNSEPSICGMADGLSDGVYEGRVTTGVKDRAKRLKTLGNAVVPQIPELIGRAILEAENEKDM